MCCINNIFPSSFPLSPFFPFSLFFPCCTATTTHTHNQREFIAPLNEDSFEPAIFWTKNQQFVSTKTPSNLSKPIKIILQHFKRCHHIFISYPTQNLASSVHIFVTCIKHGCFCSRNQLHSSVLGSLFFLYLHKEPAPQPKRPSPPATPTPTTALPLPPLKPPPQKWPPIPAPSHPPTSPADGAWHYESDDLTIWIRRSGTAPTCSRSHPSPPTRTAGDAVAV